MKVRYTARVDGVIAGTRTTERSYSHAVVFTAKNSPTGWFASSFHGTHAAAMRAADALRKHSMVRGKETVRVVALDVESRPAPSVEAKLRASKGAKTRIINRLERSAAQCEKAMADMLADKEGWIARRLENAVRLKREMTHEDAEALFVQVHNSHAKDLTRTRNRIEELRGERIEMDTRAPA
jgi:hypothetical protein